MSKCSCVLLSSQCTVLVMSHRIFFWWIITVLQGKLTKISMFRIIISLIFLLKFIHPFVVRWKPLTIVIWCIWWISVGGHEIYPAAWCLHSPMSVMSCDQQCVVIQTKTYTNHKHEKTAISYHVHIAPTSRDGLKTHLEILRSQLLVIAEVRNIKNGEKIVGFLKY